MVHVDFIRRELNSYCQIHYNTFLPEKQKQNKDMLIVTLKTLGNDKGNYKIIQVNSL